MERELSDLRLEMTLTSPLKEVKPFFYSYKPAAPWLH